ncbi:hypothetical protein [Pseudomonas viridiflava]|uniref:hypothetical protein n=1 Tax=Pseudomonas viridiflava TaxID=33069 RepID=UPI001C2D51C7|nr:hypothetical protein [Pseudomonas viridiflava]MBV1809899.1 hypothetical protein [Pseudomonas viridiflava]
MSTYIWVDTIASSDGVRKVCCPDGYEEMRNALIELIPQERRSLIRVVVMDLTKSNRRQGSCLAQPLDMP